MNIFSTYIKKLSEKYNLDENELKMILVSVEDSPCVKTGKYTKKRLCNMNCNYCFSRSFASTKESKYWSSQNEVSADQVSIYTHNKYKFDCDKCGHIFESIPKNIIGGNRCPFCSVPAKQVCNDLNCQQCFDRSFASHEKSVFWDVSNVVSPREVLKSSHIEYKFKCSECNHIFKKRLDFIVRGNWCPYCIGNELCSDINCSLCFNKSFASSEDAVNWNNNNNLAPREVCKASNRKYIFNCNNCHHTYTKPLHSNTGCPYCAHRKLCDDKNCIMCYVNSFANHIQSKYWNDENVITPRDVFISCPVKYKFTCDICKSTFESSPNKIIAGRWCPYCRHKTEKLLLDHLKLSYPLLTVIYQFKPDWCKNTETGKSLSFDFAIDELKVIIEVDGEQHFRQISNWPSPKEQRKRDIYKINKAIDNGYSIIRILQEDIYYNKCDWKSMLIEELNNYPQTINTLTLMGNISDRRNHFE